MEKYLTVEELSRIIKMSPGTIRNMVWKKEFIEGVHYVRPRPRKILFVWSWIEAWLQGGADRSAFQNNGPKGLINI